MKKKNDDDDDNNNKKKKNDDDDDDTERFSRASFHVKHAQLRWTGANTKIQITCKTAGIQTNILKHPTKQLKKLHIKPPKPYQRTHK